MLFNSLHYMIFFPLVALAYFLIPRRWQWALILVASYYFYMCWRWEYSLMLIFITAVDYWAALDIVRHPMGSRRRKLPLAASLVANLGLLFFFKYWNFFHESMHSLAAALGMEYATPLLQVLLPVGISFHTYQSVSYNIDVYYGKIEPERHLGIFALFVGYFPQLVAGPIERGAHILPQLRAEHSFDYDRAVRGLQLAAWGMFKKVVIADRLAVVVNTVYGAPEGRSPAQLTVATVFFAFQIYCDFSGYSDIALGSAEVLGVRLVQNFKRPYLAASIAEFWKRWHISLSSWFRDYVYIPLGGNRRTMPIWLANLMITFLVSGLWHGAKWTFVIWGGLNGLYLIGEIFLAKPGRWLAQVTRLDAVPVLRRALMIGYAFSLTCIGWVFFRANDEAQALSIASQLPQGLATLVGTLAKRDSSGLYAILRGLGLQPSDFAIALAAIGALIVVEVAQEKQGSLRDWVRGRPWPLRWALYYALVISVLLFGAFNSTQQFIYFQF